jgi:hypothetical protein
MLKGKGLPAHAIRAYKGIRVIAPFILNLDNKEVSG